LATRRPAGEDRLARFSRPAERPGRHAAPDASVGPDKQALLTKNGTHSRLDHRVNALDVRLAGLKINLFSDQTFATLAAEIGGWR
jgi:hypothetical protein